MEPRGQQAGQHRSWLKGRGTLVASRPKLVNSVRGIAKSHGIRFGPRGMTKWAAAVKEQCPAVLQTILEPLARIIVALTREIKELDRLLEKLGKEQYGVTQLPRSVDAVGPLTSLAYVLELNNDVRRVKRSRRMGAVAGCRPKQRDSGESSPELGITKAGNGELRRLLVQSSQRILGPFGVDSDLRRWGLGLAARGKKRAKRRAVVAAARNVSGGAGRGLGPRHWSSCICQQHPPPPQQSPGRKSSQVDAHLATCAPARPPSIKHPILQLHLTSPVQ